jgi:hypothetical protein
MDGEVGANETDFGLMVASIGGVSDENFQCFWMFAVNDELPEVSADLFELNDGDEIVFYCVDWQETVYSYFTPSGLTVEAGESFAITLMGADFMEGEFPVAGAMINVVSDNPVGILPMIAWFTDEEGVAEIFLPSPGNYFISAFKHTEDGVPMISKPLCLVTVLEKDEAGEEAAPEEPVSHSIIYSAKENRLSYYDWSIWLDDDVKPFYDEEILYFPVRIIAEKLGAEVLWDAETYTATIKLGDFTFSFRTNETVDGHKVIVIDGKSFLPAFYMAEQLGIGQLVIAE